MEIEEQAITMTKTEQHIWEMLKQGYSNDQIAENLDLQLITVVEYGWRIGRLLGGNTGRKAISKAAESRVQVARVDRESRIDQYLNNLIYIGLIQKNPLGYYEIGRSEKNKKRIRKNSSFMEKFGAEQQKILGAILTRTQLLVLYRYSKGETNISIAKRLYLSPRTIEAHLNDTRTLLGTKIESHMMEKGLQFFKGLDEAIAKINEHLSLS